MKVKELIEMLQQEDPETRIMVAEDAEGNGFSFLESISDQVYSETEDQLLNPDELEDEADDPSTYIPVLVIWP